MDKEQEIIINIKKKLEYLFTPPERAKIHTDTKYNAKEKSRDEENRVVENIFDAKSKRVVWLHYK